MQNQNLERVPIIQKGFSIDAKGADTDCLLGFFNLISYLTAISATTVLFSQIMLIFGGGSDNVPGTLIRIYGILLCIGVILAEFELTEVVRTFIVIQNWISRGLLYIFVGLLANNHEETTLDENSLSYVNLSSLSLIFLGLVYMIMGGFCMKKIRDDKMAKYIQLLSHTEIQKAIANSRASQIHDNA
jgi:hypothetical protein